MSPLAKALDSELRVAARVDELIGALDDVLRARGDECGIARDRAVAAMDRARVAVRASHLFPLVLSARAVIDGDASKALTYARAGLISVGVDRPVIVSKS